MLIIILTYIPNLQHNNPGTHNAVNNVIQFIKYYANEANNMVLI